MKTLLLTVTYLVGIGELILAVYFWVTAQRQTIRRVLALLATFTGLWVLATALISYREETQFVQFGDQLVYALGMLLVTSLLQFTVLYPYPLSRFDRWHSLLLYLPAALIIGTLFMSDEILADYRVTPEIPGTVIGGSLFPLYNMYLAVLYAAAVVAMVLQVRRVDGLMRRNATIVFWSIILGGLPGVTSDLVLPFFNENIITNNLIGAIPTGFWLGFTAYIVVKK